MHQDPNLAKIVRKLKTYEMEFSLLFSIEDPAIKN